MTDFLIALAGSAGAVSRFVVDGHIRTKYGRTFPWATFVINVTGSFVLGFMGMLVARKSGFAELGMVVGVGFCGGFTTFSTASFEAVRLLERREYKRAFGNIFGGLGAAVMVAFLGAALASIFI